MADFNYDATAELYPSRRYAKSTQQQYRRFSTATAAIQFIVEDAPLTALFGSFLEVGDRRYGGAEIRALYDADAYPLPRHIAAA